MIIGLTGKYCAGKNHVASLFEAKGLPVLDVDKLGYQALDAEKENIFAKFGKDLQKTDGSLDKRLLGQRVFGNPANLAALEAIVHPSVNKMTEDWIKSQEKHCVVNAALLHRSSIFNKLEHIILVTAPYFVRFLRAKRRDNLSFLEIIRRFNTQKDFYTQYLSINAEIYKVENSGLHSKLEKRIDKILERIF